MNLEEVWLTSKNDIEKNIAGTQRSHFLKKLTLFDHGENWICFFVPSPQDGEYIQKVVWRDIANILLAKTGIQIEFRYTTNTSPISINPEKMVRKLDRIPSDKTLDNFIVGKCNEMAFAAASAITDALGDSDYNPLYIYGETGLGKTHLMYAVANYVANRNPDIIPIYTTAEEFTNDMIYHIQSRKMSLFRQKYRTSCDLLLMDDIQFLSNKVQTQEEIFHTFESLKNHGIQIIFTSDVLPKDIKKLEPRLKTRFESGMIADMSPPDLETMLAIVKQKAMEKSIIFPDNVAIYIAQSFGGSVREAEGAINRLKMRASFEKVALINLKFAQRYLNPVLIDERKAATNPNNIIENVATTFNLRASDLKGKSRKKTITNPRHIAIYLIRKHTELSFSEIGKLFGGRDHSTVVASCKKIETAFSSNPNLSGQIEIIERNL
jgi:chromosomal replication initiator protein